MLECSHDPVIESQVNKLTKCRHFPTFYLLLQWFHRGFTKMKFVFGSVLETSTVMKVLALLGMCDPMHKLTGNISVYL